MKKYSKYTSLLMMCLMLVTSLSFTACNDDDFDTNQNRGGISLEVFGPCPVARGGELRFIGSGMDQINSVSIPGCDDITDIKVVSGREIRVTVPQTAEPGKVVLNHANGKITTLTDITFLEPISFDAENTFTPARVKPGQEVTINGEYLNLMKEVCFSFVEGLDSANVYAAEEGAFIEHTRKAIKVIVPDNAVSGPVGVSDALAEIPNLIWSELELEVVLPSVAKAIDITNAKPGDLITIAGNDLDLVRKVVMPNEDEVEFTVSEDGKKLTFNLPDNASDGAVCVVPGSGVKVAVANIGMVVPTDMTHNCGEGLRAGEELIIKGVNMDMVVSVVFPGVEEAVEPTSVSATEVKVTVPETAWSGDLVLNLKSSATATLPIVIAHPDNVVFAPSPVPGGAELTITGKNLDLIATVVFEGGVTVDAKNATATELKIKVPFTAQTGMVHFILKSGEDIEAGELTVDLPTIAYVTEWPTEEDAVKGGEIMKVKIANEDKLTAVKVNGQEVQYILNGTDLYINLPITAGKGAKIVLVSGDEEFEGEFDVIPATEVENVIWTGLFSANWNGMDDLSWGKFDWSIVEVGWKLKAYFTFAEGAEYAQMRFGNGSWASLPDTDMGYNDGNVDLFAEFPDGVAEVTITAAMKDALINQGGLVMTGANYILNKLTLWYENSLETPFYEGPVVIDGWGGFQDFAWKQDIIDNLISTWKAGQTFRIYYNTLTADTGKIKVGQGSNWAGLDDLIALPETDGEGYFDCPAPNGVIAFQLTAGAIDQMVNNNGFILQGNGVEVTKLTIE